MVIDRAAVEDLDQELRIRGIDEVKDAALVDAQKIQWHCLSVARGAALAACQDAGVSWVWGCP